MKCDNCGRPLTGGERFCEGCGSPVSTVNTVQPNNEATMNNQMGQPQAGMYGQPMNNQTGQPQAGMYGQPMNNQMGQPQAGMYGQPMNNQMSGMNPQPKKKNVGLIILLVVLIVAIVGAGGFAVYHFTQSDDTEETEKDDKDDNENNDDENNDDENNDDENNDDENNDDDIIYGEDGTVEFLNEGFVIPSDYTHEVSDDKLTVSNGVWYAQLNEFSLSYDQLQSVKNEFISQLNQTGTVNNYYTTTINGYECFVIEGVISSVNASFIITELNPTTTVQVTMMKLDNSTVSSTYYDEVMEIFP